MTDPCSIDGARELWGKCNTLLHRFRQIQQESLARGNQQNDPPAIMLQRAFDFGIRTIDGCLKIIGNDQGNALLACTLSRPFYETAVRLHWASRTHGGWQRLQSFYADEDRKWAEDAQRIPSTAKHAESVLANATTILQRTDATGNNYSPAPNMPHLLREIVRHDLIEGLRDEGSHAAEFDYANVYRFLCRGAHGHMVALGRPQTLMRHAKYGIVLATWSLLQACCHVGATDPKKEIEAIGRHLLELIQRYRNETS